MKIPNKFIWNKSVKGRITTIDPNLVEHIYKTKEDGTIVRYTNPKGASKKDRIKENKAYRDILTISRKMICDNILITKFTNISEG